MSRVLSLIAAMLLVLSCSCGYARDNILIGKWVDAESANNENPRYTEFREKSVVQRDIEAPVSYKINKNKIEVIYSIFGRQVTHWFTIIDKDTVSSKVTGSDNERVYKRVKE